MTNLRDAPSTDGLPTDRELSRTTRSSPALWYSEVVAFGLVRRFYPYNHSETSRV